MYIKEIRLKDFRNYKYQKIFFSEDVNIFMGENAQGKTNLLEGIFFNTMARSFKTSRDKDVIRFGEEFCRIETDIYYGDDDHLIEIVINREGKKGVKVDGVRIKRTSQLLEGVKIIIFSPEDLKIVKDEPSVRRSFIDREISQIRPGYLNEINRYKRALRQRNAYLKEDDIRDDVLQLWDDEIISSGSKVIRMRREFIKKLLEISGNIHSLISGKKEELHIDYETDVDDPGNEEEAFRKILLRERSRDKLYRVTTKGPHRDDIKISANGRDLKKYGSQGQQRTAALSLKLSEIRLVEEETGEKPVLLLDDVLSELDNERQKYLINSLGDNQMFITTTDIIGSVARSLPEGKIFTIRGGEVDMEI